MKEKVVIYARFSSDKQNEQSIDGQLRYCTAYATQHQMEIVHSYIDRATSGRSTKNRDEFMQMIEDSKKHGFSKILVWKLDRFARNRYDAAIYRKKLEQNNVKLVSVTENMGDGPEALLMEAIAEAMAQMYSQVLSQNVIRGMKETALNGRSTGGTIPLGYKVQDKKLAINYETAPAVRYIFDSFLNGVSYKEMANNLNERGYKTSTGRAFNKNSFHRLLKNPVYIGTYHYMDVIKENAVPAIIDKDIFNKVQAKLAIQKAAQRRHKKVDYLLTGKLFCGHCGECMLGESAKSKTGNLYYYYTCVNKKKRKCKKRRENKDDIEEFVVKKTLELVLSEERIEYLTKQISERHNKQAESGKLQKLLDRKKSLEKQYNNIVSKFKYITVERLFNDLNKEAEQIQAAIELLDQEILQERLLNKLPLTTEVIGTFLRQFFDGDLNDENFRRRVIDHLVNSVYVYDDGRIDIFYNTDYSSEPVSYNDIKMSKSSTNENNGSPEQAYSNFFVIDRVFGFSLKRENRS